MSLSDRKHQVHQWPDISGYILGDIIGDGGFSKVFRAYNHQSRTLAACKVILLSKQVPKSQRKDLYKEIKVHSQLKHDYILEFLDSKIVEDDDTTAYVPGVYMLMELAGGGDLFDKIAPDVGLDEEMAHFYFSQLVSGLSFIHLQGVCHRDLKPENLLLSNVGDLKISDFGLCSVFKHKGQTRMLSERCGSMPYVAPELNGTDPYQAEPIDVWGIGIILFTLLVGNTPWDEPSEASPEYQAYVAGKLFSVAPWDRIQGTTLSLIVGILNPDPDKRMALNDIKKHPWLNRPSQMRNAGLGGFAERLSISLRQNGDLDVVQPDLNSSPSYGSEDVDGDAMMATASAAKSQFTQSLLLFSQTQNGTRYVPQLTRFYARLAPSVLFPLIGEALQAMSVNVRQSETQSGTLRVKGLDHRKVVFKGAVTVESFTWNGGEGSFVVMARETGEPGSWRRLWKELITAPLIERYVLRRS